MMDIIILGALSFIIIEFIVDYYDLKKNIKND
jgi:hypothetical protein